MDTTEIVYFTCLNNDCPKHRNIFIEGDPEHAQCARERLYLEGERRPAPAWLRIAVPSALAAIAVGAVTAAFFLRRNGEPEKPQLPMIREEHSDEVQPYVPVSPPA